MNSLEATSSSDLMAKQMHQMNSVYGLEQHHQHHHHDDSLKSHYNTYLQRQQHQLPDDDSTSLNLNMYQQHGTHTGESSDARMQFNYHPSSSQPGFNSTDAYAKRDVYANQSYGSTSSFYTDYQMGSTNYGTNNCADYSMQQYSHLSKNIGLNDPASHPKLSPTPAHTLAGMSTKKGATNLSAKTRVDSDSIDSEKNNDSFKENEDEDDEEEEDEEEEDDENSQTSDLTLKHLYPQEGQHQSNSDEVRRSRIETTAIKNHYSTQVYSASSKLITLKVKENMFPHKKSDQAWVMQIKI